MNRRLVMAILKVAICAFLFPGCTGLRVFQKDDLAGKEPARSEKPLAQSPALTADDLIPRHPNRKANDIEQATFRTTADEQPEEPSYAAVTPVPNVLPKNVEPAADDPLLRALECVLSGRHNEALKHLGAFDSTTQDLLLRLLPMLATLKDKGLEKLSAPEVGNLHEQLEGLLNTLRPRTDLVIDKMCCCDDVKGFGKYTPVAEGHVNRPGEFVWLYVELRNFCSEHHGPFYETRLRSWAKIHDPKKPNDPPLWEHSLDDPKEPLRVRRSMHAYYQHYRFPVPPGLQPGVYTLTLTITDESQPERRRVAERSMEFRVTTAGRMP